MEGGVLILCPDVIDQIEILAEQVLEIANNLKTSDPDPRIEPLIGHLKKESRTLKEIFNEFCWLEMQE